MGKSGVLVFQEVLVLVEDSQPGVVRDCHTGRETGKFTPMDFAICQIGNATSALIFNVKKGLRTP